MTYLIESLTSEGLDLEKEAIASLVDDAFGCLDYGNDVLAQIQAEPAPILRTARDDDGSPIANGFAYISPPNSLAGLLDGPTVVLVTPFSIEKSTNPSHLQRDSFTPDHCSDSFAKLRRWSLHL